MLSKIKAYGVWKLKLTKNVLTGITPCARTAVHVSRQWKQSQGNCHEKIKTEIVYNLSFLIQYTDLRLWNSFHIKLY